MAQRNSLENMRVFTGFIARGGLVASLIALTTAGCAQPDNNSPSGIEASEITASNDVNSSEAIEIPGAPAPECVVQGKIDDGQAMEFCGPESLIPSDQQPLENQSDETPADAQADTETGVASNTHALSTSTSLSGSTTGAKVTATVVWTSDHSFELRNVKLTDTKSDSRPVFFHAHIPGFQYPDHYNYKGYNTTATWSKLPGSSSGYIHSIWLDVCRDNLIGENCGSTNTSVNPYSP